MQRLVMLKKTDEFSSVFSFKKRFSTPFFVVHYKPNHKPNQTQQLRVGFVVAKKVAKLAVDRNYMRRVLRELCRHDLPSNVAVDAVIQVQKKFESKDFLETKKELKYIFDKIQLKLDA